MLLNDFYHITLTTQGPEYRATLTLNPEHPLYRGHFPACPVLPGVCSLQMIKEAVSRIVEKPLRYAEVTNCKFISVVNPRKCNVLRLSFTIASQTDGNLLLKALLETDAAVIVKLKACLTPVAL